MKKLLLVMLVPVLVLGLFSCGKLLDAELMAPELQGTFENSAAKLRLTLTGNQASISSEDDGSGLFGITVYRVEVTGTQDKETKNIDDGKIKFVGFKDKKAKEIATGTFDFVSGGVGTGKITFKKIEKAGDDAESVLFPIVLEDGTPIDFLRK
jgi:hypothetical protein